MTKFAILLIHHSQFLFTTMFYCDICDSAFLSLNRVHGLKVNACISYLRVPWMSEVFSLEQHQL